MKIINKIKAFFCKDNEPIEMDIVAAEIRAGKAFLHPKDDPKTTYLIRSDDIRISISEGRSLSDLEILSYSRKPKQTLDPQKELEKKAHETAKQNGETQQIPALSGFEKYKKRTFSVSLYPEEYDALIGSMKEYGYKRADFLLACVQTARKPSIEKAHKQIVKTHKQMLVEQQELIKQQLSELEKDQQAV